MRPSDKQLPLLKAMLRQGFTDQQICDYFNCTHNELIYFRRKNGLLRDRGRPSGQPDNTPIKIVTYIDEHGHTVTVCPPRYAEGAESGATARPPRRGS